MSGSNEPVRAWHGGSALVLASVVALIAGCASSDQVYTSGSVHVGVGATYYDPWYWGPGYVPPPDSVGPPPAAERPDRPDRPDRPIEGPPQPTQPIALPPTRPSRPTPPPRPPATPRPSRGRR
jgi:hypothetical protein